MTALRKESERAVMIVFEACRLTGAGLATSHTVAAFVAEHLERLEALGPTEGYPSVTDGSPDTTDP